jgi:hypothetical protein
MSASVLRYRKLVTTDLANQAVNLAESGTMGHRVQIPMSVDDMNSFFVWDRPAGSDRAVGHFIESTATNLKFDDMMIASLSRVYTDVDGVTNGLNYSSAVLDANTDTRVRKDGSVMTISFALTLPSLRTQIRVFVRMVVSVRTISSCHTYSTSAMAHLQHQRRLSSTTWRMLSKC